MRCLAKKRNCIDVESCHAKIEVREGRWLRIIVKDSECSTTSSVRTIKVDTWSNGANVITHENPPNGNKDKIVVFLIHGVGGCADLWSKQIDYFSRSGYTVIAPDLLGHGGSEAPRQQPAYCFSELSQDMFAVFDRYRSEKKNILVGHSYGCSFCTMIASQRPRQVSKMVLISGGGPIPLYPEPCHLFCLPACILACLKPLLVWTFNRNGFHTHTSQDTVTLSDAFKVPSYVLRATMLGQHWSEGDEQFHSDLLVATMLIYGNHDNFVSLQEEVYMHETVYGSTLEVLENAGHMVMLECPDEVNQLIFRFLTRDRSTQSDCLTRSTDILSRTSSRLVSADIRSSSVSTLKQPEVDVN